MIGNAGTVQLLGGGSAALAAVQRSSVQEALQSPGNAIEAATRSRMEQRFGADFSEVRVHAGEVAQRSAAQVNARAYTSGDHVVVGAGGLDEHMLAHELTHVLQQRSGPVSGTDHGGGVSVSDPGDHFEREAEATADRVMSQPLPALPAPESGLAREASS